MMMDLPSGDPASSEGPTLIPIVGNNTKRGGESVLENQTLFIFMLRFIYATSVKDIRVYMQLCLMQLAYIQ